jgi:hypothetical protein
VVVSKHVYPGWVLFAEQAQSLTCLVRVGTEAEVLDGLTGVLGATEEEGVGTGRGAHGQLIDGQGLTTSGDNAGAGSVGVAEGSDRELGELKKTVVVSDGADQDDGLALVSLAGVLVGSGGNDLGERHGRAVDLAHVQTAEDSGVELAVGTAFAQKKCQPCALVDFHAAICKRASSSTAAATDLVSSSQCWHSRLLAVQDGRSLRWRSSGRGSLRVKNL